MQKERDLTYRLRTVLIRLSVILILMMLSMVMLLPPDFAYAAEESEEEQPVREVHAVGVGEETYCFFVTHNAVLTPAEIAEMTDEELTAAILERSGLYMKETNCKEESHKTITMEDWAGRKGGFILSDPDIEAIRQAEPAEAAPVKFYMDLIISEDIEAEEETLFSTFKPTGQNLIFAVVATEEDAEKTEDVCIGEKKPDPEEEKDPDEDEDKDKDKDKKKKKKKKKEKKEEEEEEPPEVEEPDIPEEILPELRTIYMVDRSGAPIEETLKDGSPVDLEWIEPKDIGKNEETSFFDRIPGGIAGFAAMAAAAAAAAAGVAVAVRRKKKDE